MEQKKAQLKEFEQSLRTKNWQQAVSSLRSRVYSSEVVEFSDFQKYLKVIKSECQFLEKCLPKIKLAILGGYSTQPISVVLASLLFSEGYYSEIYESPYDSYKIEALNKESELYKFNPDIVLFAIGSRNIPFLVDSTGGITDQQAVEAACDGFVREHLNLREVLKSIQGVKVIQHNFEFFGANPFGRLGARVSTSCNRVIQRINDKMWESDGTNGWILDVASLSSRVGLENWFDPKWFHFGKFGFNTAYLHDYGLVFMGTLRAILGKAKKCLVSDLDNTLWGGVIGDDGLNGISFGVGTPEGESYLEFCRYLKALRMRGVLLAVCSKNERNVATRAFDQHPEMPLKMSDFSSFHASWNEKSRELAVIAAELNIGIESFVFIDDNPAECAEVRFSAPAVTVVNLGNDPAQFVYQLDRLHLFDQLELTLEDLQRSQAYEARSRIEEFRQSFEGAEDFLCSLQMKAVAKRSTSSELARIEQLFGKTNQFNLTGRKYTRGELASWIDDPQALVFSASLDDRFAQHGLVTALVGFFELDSLLIDNWVMSCRVFSRTFEQFVFNEICALAEKKKTRSIYTRFLETNKNGYIKELLPTLGFVYSPEKEMWKYSLGTDHRTKSFVARAEEVQ